MYILKKYTTLLENANAFINMMKANKYYESSTYDYTNENRCNALLQRLEIIHDGISRMNDEEALDSPYRKIDNTYMKNELISIQTDLDRFKEIIKNAHGV
jgi:hypothetical protein